MKRGLTAWTMVAALTASISFGAEVYSVNTVGAIKVPIKGRVGTTNSFSLISVPMHKLPVDFGSVTANDGTSISDTLAGWTLGQFDKGVSGQEATGTSTFYIEMTSGGHEGRHFTVLSNTVSKLVILGGVDANVATGSLVNATYKIVPANRIRDIFGEPGGGLGTTVIAGGATQPVADEILLWQGGFTQSIWYNTGGIGNPANFFTWRQGGNNANNVAIDRDAGLFVLRKVAGDTNLTVTGEVSGNAQKVVLDPGFNLVGGMAVVDPAMTNSALQATLDNGTSANTADLVIPWAGSGYAQSIWYNSGGVGNPANWNTWRQGGNNAGAVELKAGAGYFIQKRTNGAVWNRPTPL